MTDKNKKRYVYFDKYLEQQAVIMKKLNSHEAKITALSFVALGVIIAISLVLYKIFS